MTSAQHPTSQWTDERHTEAVRLWKLGQSASQIAKALGGVTRHAVIGRMYRAGITSPVGSHVTRPRVVSLKHAKPATPREVSAPTRGQDFGPSIKAGIQPRASVLRVVNAEPVLLTALRLGFCRFPINDPPVGMGETMLFCGAPVREPVLTLGGDEVPCVYCFDHHRLTHQAKTPAPNIHPNADRRRFNGRQFGAGMTRRAGFAE